jgi:hypothetical protein
MICSFAPFCSSMGFALLVQTQVFPFFPFLSFLSFPLLLGVSFLMEFARFLSF